MEQNPGILDWDGTMEESPGKIDWNMTMDQDLGKLGWNITKDKILGTRDWDSTNDRDLAQEVPAMDRGIDWAYFMLNNYMGFNPMSPADRLFYILQITQAYYYPLLALIGVPVNLLTIVTLSRGKCGLSDCVTRYLVAMAVADFLVVIFDLILRHIPIVFRAEFSFFFSIQVCNIHAVVLYAVTDCSVWFTVMFTFDRFVAISWPKLKVKYCTKRTATIVLGTVSGVSGLKNIIWFFMLDDSYMLQNMPWFCQTFTDSRNSKVWIAIEFLHHILTPCVPFVLILSLNALTVRYIVVSSRARKRLRAHGSGGSTRDPEMESRRKSIILLFVISANFILLWTMLMLISIYTRLLFAINFYLSIYLPDYVQELGFMLQLLSCCTNTLIYAVTQSKFREQYKKLILYPFAMVVKIVKQ